MTPSQSNSTRCPWGQAFVIFCKMLTQETDKCILWPYTKNDNGSGLICLGGPRRHVRTELAHRLSWIMTYHERIDRIMIRQRCKNMACFNPRHLEKERQLPTPKQPKFARSGRPLCPIGTGATQVLTLSNTDTDECVPWPYSVNEWGYGLVLCNGRVMGTHRASWILNRGEIGEDLNVCHTCDNPPCINLRHLFLGTDADNRADCVRKGRHRHPRGVENGNALLTEAQVLEIRSIYRRGIHGLGCHVLAHRYGVNKSTIQSIINRKSWRHLL